MSVTPIQLELGLQVIQSYKRLAYTPWHAIAELVDNSTQSYFDNRSILDEVLAEQDDSLTVGIAYESTGDGLLRVSDNAMGMSHEELVNALKVGYPPRNTSGRSKFGMGMKTASCWIGNKWTVRTKKLGETTEHRVSVDVDRIASGDSNLNYVAVPGRDEVEHYTVIEITDHNQVFRGRTLGKIKDFLRSIYRQDLRNNWVTIEWRAVPLEWSDDDFQFLKAPDGTRYKKFFEFDMADKAVNGWVGVLEKGSRAKAGFSILNANRVIRGWPESWRPETIYGFGGRNDLINQRLVGEIFLDDFEVSHTKNDILWYGDEQEEVEKQLEEACADYVAIARRRRRKKDDDGDGPSDLEIQTAIEVMQDELTSREFLDLFTLEEVPPPEVLTQALQSLKRTAGSRVPDFHARLEGTQFEILGFIMSDASVNDPYVVVEATDEARVMIIVNPSHPHWSQLSGSEGVLNHLRHCTYDGVAEWQARRKAAGLDPDTIKMLKDRMLRLSLEIGWGDDT